MSFIRSLLVPPTAGMDDDTPRVHLGAVALIAALLAAHILARYLLKWGHHKQWQLVHVAIGVGYVSAVLVAFHGRAILKRLGRSGWAILATSLICYLVFWYWGRGDTYQTHWEKLVPRTGFLGPVYPFIYLSLSALVLRLVVPFTLGAWLAGRGAGELGLRGDAMHRDPRIKYVYLSLFLLILPVLLYAAQTPAFLSKYPLSRGMISATGTIAWEQFLGYQAFYLLVFVSGEALNRGFMTFGLEKQLGFYGIAFMLVPYVCSHFGKPLAETLGAILAGSLLAVLALRHRSIWLGVALHYGVALTMDVLAIAGNGYRLI